MSIPMHVHTRPFALTLGIILTAVGALAFIPQLLQYAQVPPGLNVAEGYGYFLNYLPVNIISKVLLLTVGVVGIGVYFAKNVEPSVKYSRAVAILMAVLAFMGLFEMTNTLFGYMPLYGAMIAFNAVVAVAGAYYGYVVPARVRSHVVKKTNLKNPAHV